MISALLRLFGCVRGKGEYEKIDREKCASFATGTGIFINVLLFAAKLTAGILAASVAVVSDAFNNASDAVSSLVALVGFKMAAKAGDKEHPLGHGRMEYVAGLIVDMLVILVGAELLKSSVTSIIHPELPSISSLTVAFLCFSLLAKSWLYVFYKKVGKKINSAARASRKPRRGPTSKSSTPPQTMKPTRWQLSKTLALKAAICRKDRKNDLHK